MYAAVIMRRRKNNGPNIEFMDMTRSAGRRIRKITDAFLIRSSWKEQFRIKQILELHPNSALGLGDISKSLHVHK